MCCCGQTWPYQLLSRFFVDTGVLVFTKTVTLLGLNTLFGRVSSYLLKQSNAVKRLCLYDEYNIESAKDIAIINTSCKVEAFLGKEQLKHAVKDADIVIIGDENLSTPYTAFDLMAPKICDYAKAIASSSPNAIIVVAASPVNILVPLLSEVLKECGCYDCNKVIGATAVDNARASCILANYMKANPQKIVLPVIGGASRDTRVPLFSQTRPSTSLTKDTWSKLVANIRERDTDIFSLKKMPEELNKAYTTVKFLNSIFAGLRGEPNNVSIAYSRTSQIPNVDYFALPVQFGRFGIQQRFGLPKVLSFENDLINDAIIYLKKDLEQAKQFFKTKEGSIELCGRNLSRDHNKQSEFKYINNLNYNNADPFQKDKNNDVIFHKPTMLNSKLRKSLTSTPPNIMVKPWDKPFDVKSFCLKNVGKTTSTIDGESNISSLPTSDPVGIFAFGNKCIKQIKSQIISKTPLHKFLTSLENPTELLPSYTSRGLLIDSITSKVEEDNKNQRNIQTFNSKPKIVKQITGISHVNITKASDKNKKRDNIKISAEESQTSSRLILKNCDKISNSVRHEISESNMVESNEAQPEGAVKNKSSSRTLEPYCSKNLFYFNINKSNVKDSVHHQDEASNSEISEKNYIHSNSIVSKMEIKSAPINSPTYSLVTKNDIDNAESKVISLCTSKEVFQLTPPAPCYNIKNDMSLSPDDKELMKKETSLITADDFDQFKTEEQETNVKDNTTEIIPSLDNELETKLPFSSSKEFDCSNSCKTLNMNKKSRLNWEKVISSRKLSSYNRSLSDKLTESSYLKYHNTFLAKKDSKNAAQDSFQNLLQVLNDEVYSDGITDFLANNDENVLQSDKCKDSEAIHTQQQNLSSAKENVYDSEDKSTNVSSSKNKLLEPVRSIIDLHELNVPPLSKTGRAQQLNNCEFHSSETKSSLIEINGSSNVLLKDKPKAAVNTISENKYGSANETSNSDASIKPIESLILDNPTPMATQSSQSKLNSLQNKWSRRKSNSLKVSEDVHCICKKIPHSIMHSNFLKLKGNRFKKCISCIKEKHIKPKAISPKSNTLEQGNSTKKVLNSTAIKESSNFVSAVGQKHVQTYIAVDSASKNSSALKNTCKALNENINKLRPHRPLQARPVSNKSRKVLFQNITNNKYKIKLHNNKDTHVNKDISKKEILTNEREIINSSRSSRKESKNDCKEKQQLFNKSKELFRKSIPHNESSTRKYVDMIKSKKTKSNEQIVYKPQLNKKVSVLKPNKAKNLLNVIEKCFEEKIISQKNPSKDKNREKDSGIADYDKMKKPVGSIFDKSSGDFSLNSILNKRKKSSIKQKAVLSLNECNPMSECLCSQSVTHPPNYEKNMKNKTMLPKLDLKVKSVLPIGQGPIHKSVPKKLVKAQDNSNSASSATSYLLRDKLKSAFSELYLSTIHEAPSMFPQSKVSEDFPKSKHIRNLYSDFTNTFSQVETPRNHKIPSFAFLQSQSWNV